jgi:uncharacterized membrane protein
MTNIQYMYLYLLTVPVFFAIDMLWLGVIAKDFYQDKLGHLLGPVNWPAAVLFYFFFIVGIIFFAVVPALEAESLQKAFFLGAFLGLLTYATYDLTNLATLKDWPLLVTVVDMIWGMVLTSSVAVVSYSIGRVLF